METTRGTQNLVISELSEIIIKKNDTPVCVGLFFQSLEIHVCFLHENSSDLRSIKAVYVFNVQPVFLHVCL